MKEHDILSDLWRWASRHFKNAHQSSNCKLRLIEHSAIVHLLNKWNVMLYWNRSLDLTFTCKERENYLSKWMHMYFSTTCGIRIFICIRFLGLPLSWSGIRGWISSFMSASRYTILMTIIFRANGDSLVLEHVSLSTLSVMAHKVCVHISFVLPDSTKSTLESVRPDEIICCRRKVSRIETATQ